VKHFKPLDFIAHIPSLLSIFIRYLTYVGSVYSGLTCTSVEV
jgi:hypothetical protein